MRTAEYSIKEMRTLLDSMSGMYDLARIVDPTECRVLKLHDDEKLSMSERCYGVWRSDSRCIECSSAAACRTGCHQTKSERFQDQIFHIQSNPVKLRLPDGDTMDAVVELISIQKEQTQDDGAVNDREAENADGRAYRYEALHDAMTKTLKADAFYQLVREKLTDSPDEGWVMVTADIMEFRLVNSLFGVEKGNDVLFRTAKLLRAVAEEGEGLCGRLGADQFSLFLPRRNYREETLRETAQTLSESFSSGIFTLCVHFGVYEIANASVPVSVMCDRANMALRTIHGDLRSDVSYFDDTIMKKRMVEQEIISGFEDALKAGQFQMYLQPLMQEDGTLFCAEALARWVRPDGTVVLPAGFIDTLERAGLIHELDAEIWEQAVRLLRRWQDQGRKEIAISVNMSAKDFYCLDVYKVLTELTGKYGVDSSRLRLEITESALIENPESTYPVIAKLQEAGFLVEIDDFGKGQSSLSLLKDIKADILKIDMGFLRETDNRTRSRIILRSVIGMANSLGMQVITEGVEKRAQMQALSDMGCRHFQGFYFSRPLPVEEFERKFVGD